LDDDRSGEGDGGREGLPEGVRVPAPNAAWGVLQGNAGGGMLSGTMALSVVVMGAVAVVGCRTLLPGGVCFRMSGNRKKEMREI
jgi:hypothetical protein